jgi:manganese/iron transport system permease protein
MPVVSWLLDPFAYGFMQRGLAAAVLVGIVCAVVGTFVVLKGLAFIGDAVSHAAFPGVVLAYLLGWPIYLGGAIAAVGTALAIGYVTRRGRIRVDTAIGVLFAGAFAFGVLLYSSIKTYAGDLLGYLLGNILGIGPGDLVQVAVLGVIVLGVVLVLRKELLYAAFDPLGAAASGLRVGLLEDLLLAMIGITIVVSIQAVGIILVVAMLVTPAATAQLLVVRFERLMLVATVVAIISSVAGLYLSFYLNLASGASIVVLETAFFGLALTLGPRTGLLSRRSKARAAASGAAAATSARDASSG